MHKYRVYILFIIIGISLPGVCFSQEYFRLKADFTVKIKQSDGSMILTKGTVYYDKNFKELIYDITFPEKEKWVSRDTSLFKIRQDTLFERVTIPSINEFTVFHLSLNAGLSDYGLKNSIYRIHKVEKKDDRILSWWYIPEQVSSVLDYVVLAKKENRLESVVMVKENEKIISRQFFRDYTQLGAFEFPQQIIQIITDETGGENYQVTEFKNLVVNDMNNNDLYHYPL
jgi:hypothetical protein